MQWKEKKKKWLYSFIDSVCFFCLQADTHGNVVVVKMLQTHERGPLSRGLVRPLVLLGAGLLLRLLLLSTCLGQDTDGNSASPPWLTYFFSHTDDPGSPAGHPAGIWISEPNSTFLTGCCCPVALVSQAAESQQEFSDSLFMCDIIHWLLWVRPPHGAAQSSARTEALPPEWDFYNPTSNEGLGIYSCVFILFQFNGCRLLSP